MSVVKTAVENGKIELVAPKEWPEGTEVVIEPVSTVESFGLRDEDGPTTPEGIAQHLALMDQAEPCALTASEETKWEAARQARGQFEKNHFDEQTENLRRNWD